MGKPATDVLMNGTLVIRRGGQKFGEISLTKDGIRWYGRKDQKPWTISWKQFDDFMQGQGKYKD